MKKILSLFLALVITLSCCAVALPAGAASFETEKGVQVKISPYLYKSTLYQMEFPSHKGYEIKEKSTEGDYAISRELNDLSYTFIFPAGTTKIECNLSLNGENNWRGFTINSTENPNYWEKDAKGNVDLTKPLTFRRDEKTAEQDEYGVQYRDYLLNTGVKGFRAFDKIYWKLSYICNGEEITEYFDIKLYDYDEAEKIDVKAVNYNVAGLPFGIFSGENVMANQRVSGKYLSENGFDIVAVQEDFDFHRNLLSALNGFDYITNHTGGIPGGDGLNIFTKGMPVYNETRVPWDEACGILSDGSDELTPKGFMYTVIDIGNGVYVDFYNLHADAYGGEGSRKARTAQFKQLARFIEERSAENNRPVIITGDFNYHLHSREDNYSLYNILCKDLGFKDAWVEFHNGGDYFNMNAWPSTGPSWGNWDSVERFMYRAGGGVDIAVSDFRYTNVTDDSGKVLSDHAAAECDFTFIKTADFSGNAQGLEAIKGKGFDFIHRLMWFITAFIKVLSDIGNLPELLKEL